VTLTKPVADYAAVQTWKSGLEEQWGEAPADFDQRAATLERFCELTGRDPDVMIEECTREVESGKRIRIKARRFFSERIDEFQISVDGDDRARARAGNVIRSFMIHNGIFMQGGVTARRYHQLWREHPGGGWLGLRQLQRAIATAQSGG
jgi:hypothetical protein